ncbi:MAG: hypothetical protein HQK51_13470 [Oligoflexia bacterium]|nr:hypothetical protein [Oligoflexia bacterium]
MKKLILLSILASLSFTYVAKAADPAPAIIGAGNDVKIVVGDKETLLLKTLADLQNQITTLQETIKQQKKDLTSADTALEEKLNAKIDGFKIPQMQQDLNYVKTQVTGPFKRRGM